MATFPDLNVSLRIRRICLIESPEGQRLAGTGIPLPRIDDGAEDVGRVPTSSRYRGPGWTDTGHF